MLQAMKQSLRHAGRRIVLTGAGAVLSMIGAGFLTVALFLALAAWQGAIFACVVMGGLYLGFGLILVASGFVRPATAPGDAPHHVAPAPAAAIPRSDVLAAVVAAFLGGLQDGMAARTKTGKSSRK